MYVKALMPTAPDGLDQVDLPFLLATAGDGDVMRQLRTLGWESYGDDPQARAAGLLQVTHDRLRLDVGGMALLEDLNPAAPPGWWAAVDEAQGHCFVVIVKATDVDLQGPAPGTRLKALMGTGRAVWAIVTIEHPAGGL